ncbi:hypothetical protein [Okeania sp. KiyG1]|uniref:hypothetical protein n=1 Tax=Okeania sp. KiyG1 TaxID=2720165 RepID=UPI0019204590|nr:hypothetical protein [Okeania sp. KiyG1]GGA01203.1 hypothetical protein CYANOKiyG1_13040 [Okeania sp. KiyG1]
MMMNIASFFQSLIRLVALSLLVAVLVIGGFQTSELSAYALGYSGSSDCNYLNIDDVEGKYECEGQCVVKGISGLEFLGVLGETDTIEYLRINNEDLDPYNYYYDEYNPYDYENREDFYRVTVEGKDNFSEVEIGPLVGTTMQTATTQVSDNKFPVVEKYLFDARRYEGCEVKGFTKIVSNPTEENFKSCVVECSKITDSRF